MKIRSAQVAMLHEGARGRVSAVEHGEPGPNECIHSVPCSSSMPYRSYWEPVG